jgi:nucleotide-binding universal stress UspA family protein
MTRHIQPIRRILVATGLTEESVGAVRMAQWLAQTLDAQLHAVHVIAPMSPTQAEAMGSLGDQIETQGREALQRFLDAQGLTQTAQCHVVRGEPEDQIVATGLKTEADLIVIGRWGRGGKKHGALGSIADRVVRRYPLSVLIVEPNFRGPIKNIGVASACADDTNLELERGIELAAALGQDRDAMNHAYHVPAGYHLVSDYDEAVEKLAEVHERIARNQIAAARQAIAADVEVDLEVELGPPHRVLAELAQKTRLDLLITGAHSRTKSADLLLDHVAERIINNAVCNIWAEKNPTETHRLRDLFRHLLD